VVDHHGQAVDGHPDHAERPVDHAPDRRVLDSDDFLAADDGPQPVEKMQELASGYSWE